MNQISDKENSDISINRRKKLNFSSISGWSITNVFSYPAPAVREDSRVFNLTTIFKKEDIMPQTFKPRSCHDCLFSEGICDEMPVGADPDTFRCNHYEWKYA